MPDSTTPPDDRILAVDFGTRRVGLALGNRRDGIAVSLVTLELGGGGVEEAVRRVAEVARNEVVNRLLVGLPLNMDGSAGPAARRARAFGEKLSGAAGLPVLFLDERLTSEAARDLARQSSGGKRVKKAIDDLAAVVLLQGWFDDEKAGEARRRWDSAP